LLAAIGEPVSGDPSKLNVKIAMALRKWRACWTLPVGAQKSPTAPDDSLVRKLLELPQENILYFLEKNAPKLAPWQRDTLWIVRLMAQYFYP
jgi:spore cortex formation protein SpoVR/YcgB (stage V sporulation)